MKVTKRGVEMIEKQISAEYKRKRKRAKRLIDRNKSETGKLIAKITMNLKCRYPKTWGSDF